MKLSEKGRQKLAKKRKELESGLVKFEPNDFEGSVVLTVEEASNIWEHLINYESSIEENEGCMSFKHLEVRDSVRLMRKRIKQAESQND